MKIFVLLSRFPYPLEKGDKLRAFWQIKELSVKHDIVLCALSDVKVDEDSIAILLKYCSSVEVIYLPKWRIYINVVIQLLFTDKSLQVAYFYNKSAQKKIDRLLEKYKPDHIYCQLIRVAEYVRHSKIRKTLDYMDALARGMERRIDNAPFYLKLFLKIEAIRLKRYEHFIFNDFDNSTIISDQDRRLIVNAGNDRIKVVSNGVDTSKYQFKKLPKEYDLIFTGNMSYPPNIDSVLFLVNNIMPLLWKINPNIKLAIVGASPDKKVLRLKTKKVEVTGWVKDITDYYAKSKVFIAPLQIGTGLQNKLLEAMAMELPCVTSQLANNALGATDGEDILIGNTPAEYAEHINTLLNNTEKAQQISKKGSSFVKKNYTWEKSTAILEQLISSN